MSKPETKKIPPFPEMWENAKGLGVDLEELAEAFYEQNKTKLTEVKMQTQLNILCKIHCYLEYLNENKIEVDTTNKIKKDFKNHRHVEGKVVIPWE